MYLYVILYTLLRRSQPKEFLGASAPPHPFPLPLPPRSLFVLLRLHPKLLKHVEVTQPVPFHQHQHTFRNLHNSTFSCKLAAIGVKSAQPDKIFLRIGTHAEHQTKSSQYRAHPNRFSGHVVAHQSYITIDLFISCKPIFIRTHVVRTPRVKNPLGVRTNITISQRLSVSDPFESSATPATNFSP